MKCELFGNPAQSAPIHQTFLPHCLPYCPPQRATGTAGFGFDTTERERQILPQPICSLNICTERYRGNTTAQNLMLRVRSTACEIIAVSGILVI